ncbi:MAG: alkyl sulfatase dimerization domain-containing protein [Nitrososphaeraceae archaeon]
MINPIFAQDKQQHSNNTSTALQSLTGIPYPDQPPINPKLEATQKFWSPPAIHKVTDNVWSAVAYSLANGIMIEGTDGLIIIDTGMTYEEAKNMIKELRKIEPDKPVKAIIYTHGHVDHVSGAGAFVEEAKGGKVDIYAHDSTLGFYVNENALLGPIQSQRAAMAAGALLPKEGPDKEFMGIFPVTSPGNVSFVPPTKTFSDEMDIEVAGVKLKLIHVQGETTDHINVWMPEEKVLFIGDNSYGIVPNIYSLRGHTYRDPIGYVNALDTAIALKPEFMVGSHQKPVSGNANITEILTAVRDATQYIYDQTIRGMNQGYTADELAQMITLPKQLQEHPWLNQARGLVPWYVKQIYYGNLGWYEGDPAFLNATSLVERSKHIVDGFGGVNQTLLKVREAIDDKDYQWASELATYVLKFDPNNTEAKLLKAHALRIIGQQLSAADGRNWYLTTALELEGKLKIDPNKLSVTSPQQLASLPVDDLLKILSTKISPVKAEGVNKTLGINFTDLNKDYTLNIRHSILAVHDIFPQNPDMSITLDSDTYKSIVNGTQSIVNAVKSGNVKFEGNIKDLESFVSLFDPLLMYKETTKYE